MPPDLGKERTIILPRSPTLLLYVQVHPTTHPPLPLPQKKISSPLAPFPPKSPLQRPKSSPSLRNPHRQRRRRKQNTRAPKNSHEPKRIISARVPAILPQRPEARRLLAIHISAEFAEAVAVDGELGVGDAFVGQFFAGAGPLQEEVGGRFEAEGVVADVRGGGGGGGGGGKRKRGEGGWRRGDEFGEERAGVGRVVGCLFWGPGAEFCVPEEGEPAGCAEGFVLCG